jgi:hypothetical protein
MVSSDTSDEGLPVASASASLISPRSSGEIVSSRTDMNTSSPDSIL